MKEATLIKMQREVAQVSKVVQNLYMELSYQRQINETLANVCQKLPGWTEAVEQVKKANEEAKVKKDEAGNGGEDNVETSTDTTFDFGPQEQKEGDSSKEETPE